MGGLIYALPVIFIIAISALVVRVATVALKITGLDEKRAYFQALSAFTGTGFTTKDSELVFENDVRRQIIIVLMILGNAGLVTVITTIVFSFERGNLLPVIANAGIAFLIILILFKISTQRSIARFLNDRIESRLRNRPLFQRRPVEEVLRIAENYGIAEVSIKNSCRELNKMLSESSLRANDILVLAIERKGEVIPTPKATDRIILDDTLICYGKLSNIEKIIMKE